MASVHAHTQFQTIGQPLDPDVWYTVTLSSLGQGSSTLQVTVNGETATHTGSFEGVNFEVFDGPLFIGGHPLTSSIQVYDLNSCCMLKRIFKFFTTVVACMCTVYI